MCIYIILFFWIAYQKNPKSAIILFHTCEHSLKEEALKNGHAAHFHKI